MNLFSCNNPKETSLQTPVIIDTANYSQIQDPIPKGIPSNNFQIFYIGKYKDTIILDRRLNGEIYYSDYGPYPRDTSKYVDLINDALPDNYCKGQFQIFVDTTQELVMEFISPTSPELYKAFPVFIINNSDSNAYLFLQKGYGIELGYEHKSKTYAFEECYEVACGRGATKRVIIPPKEILVTGVRQYRGPQKFKARIFCGLDSSEQFEIGITDSIIESAIQFL